MPGDEVLTVNVFTPSRKQSTTPTSASMPVFVWIHGGAFIAGSPHSPWYDGAAFNHEGIVVVAIGYRVGLTGFGNVDGAPANRAVHDWIAALRWVHDNIARFGGDAHRVTIGGQSAGAAAVLTLMGVEEARGLFHRVIASSPVLLQMTPEKAQAVTEEAASLLGVAPTAFDLSTRSRVELANVVWQMGAFGKASAEASPDDDLVRLVRATLDSVQLPPVADGHVLPLPIAEAIRRGASAGMPLLIGSTAHEFNTVVAHVGKLDVSDQEAIERLGFAPEVATAYIRARPGLHGHPLIAQLLSDVMVRGFVASIAEAHEPTWVYDFAWLPTGEIDPGVAFHCLDLPFAWAVHEHTTAKRATGETPDGLVEDVHRSWVRFIHGDGPVWQPYLADRTVRQFDVVSQDVLDGLSAERLLTL